MERGKLAAGKPSALYRCLEADVRTWIRGKIITSPLGKRIRMTLRQLKDARVKRAPRVSR